MIKIRYGVFESNSSSTHSLLIAQNEEIEKLNKNELLINLSWDYKGNFIPYEEALELLDEATMNRMNRSDHEIVEHGTAEEIYALMREYDIAATLEDYMESEYLEWYDDNITTQHGDRIYVFGLYGRD